MARLVSEVLATARTFLQDTTSSPRYSDADLLNYYNLAVSEARRLRPDLFYGQINNAYTPAVASDAFAMHEMYFLPVVNYVTALAELRDDEFTSDGRITYLTNRFGAALTSLKA